VRRAALPADEPGSPRILEIDRVVCGTDLGACPVRSPPAA
jgi:hypothetical protein